jgi:autotransporter-associated beta strand protein
LTLDGAQGGSLASIVGTGSGTLTKAGAGTWTLSGANSYTGASAINAGTLRVTHSTALGRANVGDGGVSVANGATLQFTPDSGNLAIGDKALTLADGASVSNTAGANTYAGAVSLSGSASVTVDTGSSLNFSSTTGTVIATGKTLTVVKNGNLTWTGALSGAGALSRSGSGTFTANTGGITGSITDFTTNVYVRAFDSTGVYASVYGSDPSFTFASFLVITLIVCSSYFIS